MGHGQDGTPGSGWDWMSIVRNAVREDEAGDPSSLALLAKFCAEADDAKQELRRLGYGWTGLGLRATVDLVPSREAR